MMVVPPLPREKTEFGLQAGLKIYRAQFKLCLFVLIREGSATVKPGLAIGSFVMSQPGMFLQRLGRCIET